MRTSLVTAIVLVAIASGGRAAPRADDQKAREVLAAARNAIGGPRLASVETLSVEAALQRNLGEIQLSSDVEILVGLPDRYLRTDVPANAPGGGFATGFSGDRAIRPAGSHGGPPGAVMIRIGPGGAPPPGEPLSPEEQAAADDALVRAGRADISRLMLGWFAAAHPSLGATYTYAGEAESPDGRAHVIEAAAAGGFTARLFIDQDTHLPLMVTYLARELRIVTAGGGRGGPPSAEERARMREEGQRQMAEFEKAPPPLVEHTLFFDDWRETGGIRFPHTIRRAAAGTTNEEWTIRRVRVNPKLDPKKFQG